MKKLIPAILTCFAPACFVHGAVLSVTFGGGSVPDAGFGSQTFTGNVAASGFISKLTVGLVISGEPGAPAYNGDLYVTLQHGGGFSVLLNRTGRTASDDYGYGDNGFSVTLDDSGPSAGSYTYNDIHTYQDHSNPGGSALTGTWSADGRNTDPGSVLDTDARTASLNSFLGLQFNGLWTLFVQDLSSGGRAKVDSWTLEITTTPVVVPEPAAMALLTALGLAGFVGWRRYRARS